MKLVLPVFHERWTHSQTHIETCSPTSTFEFRYVGRQMSEARK